MATISFHWHRLRTRHRFAGVQAGGRRALCRADAHRQQENQADRAVLGDGDADGRHVGLPVQPELAGQLQQFQLPQSIRERRSGVHRQGWPRRQRRAPTTCRCEQLAKAAQLGSDAFASASTTVGTGTLTISVGDSSFSIEVGEGGNSLANIRDAINKSAANKGVQASLLTDVEGTHLVLTSTKTGADRALTVTASGGDGGLEQLETHGSAERGPGRHPVRVGLRDPQRFEHRQQCHRGRDADAEGSHRGRQHGPAGRRA